MLIGNSRRWLLAAAVFPLVLAGCASPGAGTGTAATSAGPGSAASGSHRGLSAVRHVWVIVLLQGPARTAACSPATFASASARTAWACAAFSSALSAFARARSAFPGGSRLVWLLTPMSIMMLAAFLIIPITTISFWVRRLNGRTCRARTVRRLSEPPSASARTLVRRTANGAAQRPREFAVNRLRPRSGEQGLPVPGTPGRSSRTGHLTGPLITG